MRKAQALFFVLFILAVFGALSGALTLMWQSEIQTRSSERDGLIAFYLAQAGIERAKIEARYGTITAPAWSTWQNLGGGRYSFFIQDIGGNQRQLRSIGQTLNVSGNSIAERQIEARVQGIGSPPESQIPWSWREI